MKREEGLVKGRGRGKKKRVMIWREIERVRERERSECCIDYEQVCRSVFNFFLHPQLYNVVSIVFYGGYNYTCLWLHCTLHVLLLLLLLLHVSLLGFMYCNVHDDERRYGREAVFPRLLCQTTDDFSWVCM